MEPTLPFGQGDIMTNSDEDLPRPTKKLLLPPPLDLLGVTELHAYIADLEAEILRVRQAIASKQAHRDAAAAFFKTPPQG
jgi:uncharacterized small protein (DUF1192 family)